MTSKRYLFYGFGSEYVLHPVYEKMRDLGYDCLEIDALREINSVKAIHRYLQKKQPIVLATSAHFLLDKHNFSYFYPNKHIFYSLLELIKIIRPVKVCYLPHDLTQPTIAHENDYLGWVDLFLSPGEPFTSLYAHYCPTEEVGWIKYQKNTANNKKLKKAVWILSDYILHYQWGTKKSFQMLSPVLRQGVAIKFPRWTGCDEFVNYYRSKGVKVFPADSNTVDLIQSHEIVLCNGLSSVNTESYWLGKTTVNIMERSHYGRLLPYLKALCPNMVFIQQIKDFRLGKIVIQDHKHNLMPFDFEKTIHLITDK